jgi:DNA-binding NarL/FixJ family response regulator
MINVILADHERVFRIGMASALAAEDDIRIVGQPATATQVIHGVQAFKPQVLVLSSAFLGCIDAIRLSCDQQHTAMLLLQDCGSTNVHEYSSDFQGVIHRSADEATVMRFIRHLARGGRVVRLGPRTYQEKAVDHLGIRVRRRLTPQEIEIVAYLVQGYKNREIAARMATTEPGIKSALRRIFDKTGVSGRLELALFVLHHRLLSKPPEPRFAFSRRIPVSTTLDKWDVGGRPIIN